MNKLLLLFFLLVPILGLVPNQTLLAGTVLDAFPPSNPPQETLSKGGKIWGQSEPGKGSTFSFALPK